MADSDSDEDISMRVVPSSKYVEKDDAVQKEKPPVMTLSSLLFIGTDFANTFKAFIGSNYLSMPYAFQMSGWLFGIPGLLLIALITDHCCGLIVDCKRLAVNQQLKKMMNGRSSIQKEVLGPQIREELEKEMQYGDIGRIAYGRAGLHIVNIALLVTQFGFCVGYFIFLGTTLERILSSGSATLMMLLPLPVLAICSFLRKTSAIAPLSIIADVAVLAGFVSMMIYLSLDFEIAETINAYEIKTFAIFFGTVTSSYEGIGTIIPIETGMKTPRKRFPWILHAALITVSCILGSFGVMGYMVYGDQTPQIISQAIPEGSPFALALDITLVIGIAFTYPLQLVPVIQIVEKFLFFGGFDTLVVDPDNVSGDQLEPDTSLLTDAEQPHVCVRAAETAGLHSAKEGALRTWQRNAVRGLAVAATMLVAMLFQDYFAYWTSIIGAVGSSVLAFILPCAFHIRLNPNMSGFVFWKDVSIIVFGIIGGMVSLTVNVFEIIAS